MQQDTIAFEDVWTHFNMSGTLVKGGGGSKVRQLIWLATTWCLWRIRNNIMFRGVLPNLLILVDQIMDISWFWFIGRI
jgi:hypothetical protein